MRPRRGEATSRRILKEVDELQRGRGDEAAEGVNVTATNVHEATLQRGRGDEAAEGAWGQSPQHLGQKLQRGRGDEAAEG